GCVLQGAKQRDQRGELVIGVEAARIGQYPDARAREAFWLLAKRGAPDAERMAIGADAEERDHSRPQPVHLGGEALRAGDELLRRDLVGGGGGAIDEIGDAITRLQQQALL